MDNQATRCQSITSAEPCRAHGVSACLVCQSEQTSQTSASRGADSVADFLRRCAGRHLAHVESGRCDPQEIEPRKRRAARLLERAAQREADACRWCHTAYEHQVHLQFEAEGSL